MKALFYDWNVPGLGDGRYKAYRADPAWPMPEVGETIAVGEGFDFFAATVESIVNDKFALVRSPNEPGNRVPVPLGWPHDDAVKALCDEMSRTHRYRAALQKIADDDDPQPPATKNQHYVPWQAKAARAALASRDSQQTETES